MSMPLRKIEEQPPDRNELELVDNPQNRLDVLGYRLAERLVTRVGDPVLDALWANLRHPFAEFLADRLKPVPPRGSARKRVSSRSRRRRHRREDYFEEEL